MNFRPGGNDGSLQNPILQAEPVKDNSMHRISAAIVAICFCLLARPLSLHAGDWPQILGPDRNGKAHDERVAVGFPPSGPKTLWEQAVGSGFAGTNRGAVWSSPPNNKSARSEGRGIG